VKRRVPEKRREGWEWTIFLILSPLILPFLIGFAYILHEEFFKVIGMFRLHPSTE
jgi:hypothetical protein